MRNTAFLSTEIVKQHTPEGTPDGEVEFLTPNRTTNLGLQITGKIMLAVRSPAASVAMIGRPLALCSSSPLHVKLERGITEPTSSSQRRGNTEIRLTQRNLSSSLFYCRDYLSPASAFESLQFRLIENKLGMKKV